MYLKKLSLINFKNIPQADILLSDGINCFVGCNGAGKTNVIDAVYYLSMCKSSLAMTDGQSVRHGEGFFMLSGDYVSDANSRDTVTCGFQKGAGKTLKRNSKEYERLSDHIGTVPAVIVSPGDVFLINDAADERRKWLNSFISQTDRAYLESLMRYNRALAERNKLLKQPAGPSFYELLDVLDQRLASYGDILFGRRKEMIERLGPVAAEYYREISGDRERVELQYQSELEKNSLEELLRQYRQKDMITQFTTAGIHRDDMKMTIAGHPLRKYGSQGQQKSFLIALKLAQHTLLKEITGERPVLLLDDLFDKLDAQRLGALIDLVGGGRFGQIIISDCNRERLTSILDNCGVNYALFGVDEGVINKER